MAEQTRRNRGNVRGAAVRIPVAKVDPSVGLTAAQVRERTENGLCNFPVKPPTKTEKEIFLTNVFTYFNMVFFLLAAFVIYVRSWNNLLFLGVVVSNTALGIIQEWKAKQTLDRLAILTAPKCRAIRDGKTVTLDTAHVVRDDIVCFSAGDQICADAVVADGICTVNEALITGEADEIRKSEGDSLLSGSYVISGICRARLTAVGAEAYAASLMRKAGRLGRMQKTGMMRDLSLLVKWIGLAIVPLGILMFCKEYLHLEREFAISVTSTVGSLIGMIPEGLYLLTSLALLAGVIRLARRKTLVRDMSCIETLARVDVLCVDKTGTITEPEMTVERLVLLQPERYPETTTKQLLADFAAAMTADNETIRALRKAYARQNGRNAVSVLPFSAEKKYSGVSFGKEETCLLGAPEVLLGRTHPGILEQAEACAADGSRVLLFAVCRGVLENAISTAELAPIALLLLSNRIRREASSTFAYFREQGVSVKVISGDHPQTASRAALHAGISGAEHCIDVGTLRDQASLEQAAETYTVFGRVTPEQKCQLIRALKAAGHTVAMTGDGVNDILALKEANCSVAMASGSDAACRVSQIVLLQSDFSSMPSVVEEGRRVIHNIERSAALYLVKNILSFCLALITLCFALPYPFSPTQLTLVGALTIGIPSFVLAMEPNNRRIEGNFLRNIICRAIPAAMTDVVMVVTVLLLYPVFGLTEGALSTICTCVMGIVGLLMVNRTSQPYTPLRKLLVAAMSLGFAGAVLFLGELFTLSVLAGKEILIVAVLALLAKPVFDGIALLRDTCIRIWRRNKKQNR